MNNILILIYIYYYFSSIKELNFLTINKRKYNYILKRNYLKNEKYFYIFFYLLFELFRLKFLELNKKNKYFRKFNLNNINDFFIKYKDNNLLIYLENYKNNLLIHNFKNIYFLKDKKINIFLYKDFIFKIEIVIFLIYRDHIE